MDYISCIFHFYSVGEAFDTLLSNIEHGIPVRKILSCNQLESKPGLLHVLASRKLGIKRGELFLLLNFSYEVTVFSQDYCPLSKLYGIV